MFKDPHKPPAGPHHGLRYTAGGTRSVHTARLIEHHLTESAASWSVGELGALAEFHHHGPTSQPDPFTLATAGGAIRVDLEADTSALAYETPSANPRLWNHGIVLCLPASRARMAGRARLTEIGADTDAIFGAQRDQRLFDLGLGLCTADFLVRTDDAALIRTLRRAEGRSWFDDDALNATIVAASPTRILASRLARIEVTNPIPQPAGVSPDGPHTHLLPALLRRHRVYDANIPVPRGALPCLMLYPAHPARDPEGNERAFDAGLHEAFQALLAQFGDPQYLSGKQGKTCLDSRLAHLGRIVGGRQRALLDQYVEKT